MDCSDPRENLQIFFGCSARRTGKEPRRRAPPEENNEHCINKQQRATVSVCESAHEVGTRESLLRIIQYVNKKSAL